jgi:hypothetical protein
MKYMWYVTVGVREATEVAQHVAVSISSSDPISIAPTDEDRSQLRIIQQRAFDAVRELMIARALSMERPL